MAKAAEKQVPAEKAVVAKKPAAKKPAAAASKDAAPVKKVAKPRATATKKKAILPEERHNLIEVAAYYIAERHGFSGGRQEQDWLEASKQIDEMIAAGSFTGR